MVDILTDTGVFLDLDPDAEFEITIENPLLQDDRIPVPFSTAISFLPTPTNKAVFGYLNTMMLQPTVREVGASILVGGIPLYAGTLIYDSIDENGRINYTFSGKDLETEWAAKIWELDLSGDVYYPLVVDAAKTAAAGIGVKETGQRPGNLYNVDGKYRNSPDDTSRQRMKIPAVPAGTILGSRVSFGQISGALDYLGMIVVFGTYADALPNAFSALPDIGFADFVQALCRMFCAAVFQDGGEYRIVSAPDILGAGASLDWDGKVSDRFRATSAGAEGYALGYSDGEEGDSADSDETAATLAAVVSGAEADYEVAKHTPTGDLYSRKVNTVSMIGVTGHSSTGNIYGQVGTIDEILIDRVGASGMARAGEEQEKEKAIDIGFRLPKCAPAGWTKRRDGQAAVTTLRMAPILSLPATGADRPTDVYIALYGNGQACDKGVVVANPDNAASSDQNLGLSLAPDALFERYHQEYAAWLARDRQLLSVDLNLTPTELAAFRMWQTVRVRSRNWLVSKLSVRISAAVAGIDVSGDLIAL